jgi:hypothetical protein
MIESLVPPRTLYGMRVVASPLIPDEVPVLKLHPDFQWCTPEFRADFDRWALEMFGTKEVVFMLNDQQMFAMSKRMQAKLDHEINKLFGLTG